MAIFSVGSFSKSILALAVAGSVASCSSFRAPAGSDIKPEDYKAEKYTPPYSMNQAVAYARAVEAEYMRNIDDQFLLRNMTDLALIPIAGAAAFAGVSGYHTDILLGLAVAGTGTYLLGERYSRAPEQLIYAGGSLAMNCVLGTFRAQRVGYGYRERLVQLVGGVPEDTMSGDDISTLRLKRGDLSKTINELQTALSGYQNSGDPAILAARGRLETGKAVLEMGQAALNELDLAGDDLVGAVNAVKAQVARALIRNRIDGGAFKAAVENAFQSSLVNIPEVDDQIVSDGGGAGKLAARGLTPSEKDKIESLTATLHGQIQEVRQIAKKVSEPPAPEALAKCAVDVDLAGITLAVSTESIKLAAIDDGAGGKKIAKESIVNFQIFGGTPPYFGFWTGVIPDDVEQPTITTAGVLSAKLGEDVPAGSYKIAVRDSSTSASLKTVKIQIGDAPLPGVGNLTPTAERQKAQDANEVRAYLAFLWAAGAKDASGNPVEVGDDLNDDAKAALKGWLRFVSEKSDDEIAQLDDAALRAEFDARYKVVVTAVQESLMAKGFNEVTPTGELDEPTVSAMQRYLDGNPRDGQPAASELTLAETLGVMIVRHIWQDDQTSRAQVHLVKNGYRKVEVTEDGVQKEKWVTVDGKLGPVTVEGMRRYFSENDPSDELKTKSKNKDELLAFFVEEVVDKTTPAPGKVPTPIAAPSSPVY